MDLTTASRAVTDEIARSSEKLVELLSDLVAFDTTAREVEQASGDARDEAKLQAYLAARLGSLGAVTDVWEPDTDEVADCRHVPAGLTFEGYRSCLPPSRAAESARTCCSTDPSTWCPASRSGPGRRTRSMRAFGAAGSPATAS